MAALEVTPSTLAEPEPAPADVAVKVAVAVPVVWITLGAPEIVPSVPAKETGTLVNAPKLDAEMVLALESVKNEAVSVSVPPLVTVPEAAVTFNSSQGEFVRVPEDVTIKGEPGWVFCPHQQSVMVAEPVA
jgi:hypothetical protein